jgi:hypothetical protein
MWEEHGHDTTVHSPVRHLLAVVGLTALMTVAVSAPASAEQRASASTPSATAPVDSMSDEFEVPVPDMFGFSLEEATAALEASGLLVGRVRQVPVGICEYIGLVVGQDPGADTHVPQGTKVNLYIGRQPPFPLTWSGWRDLNPRPLRPERSAVGAASMTMRFVVGSW